MLFPRPFETDTWVETFEESATGEGWREHTHLIKTPDGDLDYSYRTEDGFGTSCHDFMLKGDNPEAKLPALRHFPHADLYDMSVMKGMVEKVGDEAWWLHHVIGPWDMAAEVRGLVDLSMDVYDRPQFVHDLMRVCTDWLKPFYRRLGETGIHSISMNETWVGVGVSLEHFREFMKPYEEECVAGGARGRLHGQLPQLRPRHPAARGHRRHRPGRHRDPDLEPLQRRRRPRRRQEAHRRPRLPVRRLQRAPAARGRRGLRARGGQALPRRRDGRRRLRAALDRARSSTRSRGSSPWRARRSESSAGTTDARPARRPRPRPARTSTGSRRRRQARPAPCRSPPRCSATGPPATSSA